MSGKISLDAIRKQRDELEDRLEKGWKQIQESQVDGKDNEAWTDHFIDLLHQYERLCDVLIKAA